MDFWKNVKKKIKDNKFTQDDVADKLGMSKRTFKGWISKNILPDVETAFKISEILNVSISDLCGYSESLLNGDDLQMLQMYHSLNGNLKKCIMNILKELSDI